MSLWNKRGIGFPPAADLIPRRTYTKGASTVTNDDALHVAAVWACLRLRANLISSMPVDVYRRVDSRMVEVPKPPVLVRPGGATMSMREYLYSTQIDLDRAGNSFSIILSRDGLGFPRELLPVAADQVTAKIVDGAITEFRIRNKIYSPAEIHHERQYTVPGLPIGLSPVMYAAWTLSEYRSILDFATEWFDNGTRPSAVLKNTERHLPPDAAAAIKDRYRATVANGDVFVVGSDWELEMMSVEAAASQWLDAKKFSVVEIARFFDVPVDLIDGAVSGQSVTYANVAQRNLQFLVMSLGPAVARREDALSMWVPAPRFVKLNTDALLRMDAQARSVMLGTMVRDRLITPNEARELDNRAPYTTEQLAEFDALFSKDDPQPAPAMMPMQE